MKLLSTKSKSGAVKQRLAFTLIELLVVIAIIGILAGLLIPLAGIATTKMRISRVKAELNRYVNAIETYKLETGEYPPDNGELRNMSSNNWFQYQSNAGLNPLFYELTGAIFTNRQFVTIAENEKVAPETLTKAFNVDGIRNSARGRSEIDYKGFNLKPSQYVELDPSAYGLDGADVEVLSVPVPGPFILKGNKNEKINPWFYDASSTNRHNASGFDLWAEIEVGGKTQVIANWKN